MAILELRDVRKQFGGFEALRGISMTVEKGEVRGLIGSNGAGKSTLLHAIYGQSGLDGGQIVFRDADVSTVPAFKRVRLGMALKLQLTSVFEELTVAENLRVAYQTLARRERVQSNWGPGYLENALNLVDLHDRGGDLAGTLSHGEQQWLELAMALLTEPKLLLLDEPTSGMTHAERQRTAGLLTDLSQLPSIEAIMVVEHDLDFIGLVSNKVTVMHRGAVIADGTVAEVEADEAVRSSYLGMHP